MRRIRFIAIVFCMVIVITGCSKKQSNINNIKVGTWKTAQTIQPFTYKQFLDEEDNIEVFPFTNPGDQKAALLSGELDMCGTTLVTAIIAASKGEPIKIISGLCNKCSAIVVGKDSNIEKVEDLKGKVIAYVPGTMHHILLLETLERVGLDPDKDVELKRIDFFDMGQALARGDIDAFCSGEPSPSIALSEKYGQILTYPYYDESIGYINAVMITTEDRIEKDREKIKKLVTAHVKSTEYLKGNRKDWLDKAQEFGTDKKVLELAVDNMDLAWEINQEMIEQTKNLAKRMEQLGVISKVPDIEELFNLSFIEYSRKELKNEKK
ncbi:ABC transporter substrate-binding protein [Clostridium sediminicola]|uniref:ABC transporter substrate-binding protein n=1 Tax=Clostridium sediminicola TaxID=3114879 RepID=UPI0031F23A03